MKLNMDCYATICSFLPLSDALFNTVTSPGDLPIRFVKNIGVTKDEESFILECYFNKNTVILQELLNSNHPVAFINSFLHLWECYQPNPAIAFEQLIISESEESLKSPTKRLVDGLEKMTIMFILLKEIGSFVIAFKISYKHQLLRV